MVYLFQGAVVAHWEQWWLIGTVVTQDCKPAVPGSNPAISPAYSGLPILRWLPFGTVLHCRLSSEGWQRRINTKKGLWSTKNNEGEKIFV
jgi:hypothetical protein